MNNFINYQVNDENHVFISYERFYDLSIGAEVSMAEWMGKITEVSSIATLYSACADKGRKNGYDYSCDAQLQAAKYIGPGARSKDDEESVDAFSFTPRLSCGSGLTLIVLFMMTMFENIILFF